MSAESEPVFPIPAIADAELSVRFGRLFQLTRAGGGRPDFEAIAREWIALLLTRHAFAAPHPDAGRRGTLVARAYMAAQIGERMTPAAFAGMIRGGAARLAEAAA